MKTEKILSKALVLAAALGMCASAQAALIDPYLGDDTILEDDSNEFVFRFAEGVGYLPVLTGEIQNGDVLLQILDFPQINANGISQNIDSDGIELTGVAVNVVENVTDIGTRDPDGPGAIVAYDAVSFDMVAASADTWLALTGININAFAFDTTGLIALLYEDSANNLDLYDDLATEIAAAKDGDLVIATGIVSDDVLDYLFVSSAPKNIDTFADPNRDPGTTIFGDFVYHLSILYEDLDGEISDISGTGTNIAADTERLAVTGIIDDTQASFERTRVPEPTAIGALGLGLLGLGIVRRRSSKSKA